MMSETTSIPVVVPRENVNDETVTLVSWHVANGERVEQGQRIAQIETSKTVLELEAPISGVIRYGIGQGEEVEIGAVICYIDGVGTASLPDETAQNDEVRNLTKTAEPAPAIATPAPPGNDDAGRVGFHPESLPQSTRFSRQAGEMIERLGLDPQQFEGCGLVRTRDVQQALDGAPAVPTLKDAQSTSKVSTSAAGQQSGAAHGVAFRSERLPRAKRREAEYIRSAYETTLTSAVTIACRTLGFRAAVKQHAPACDNAAAIVVFEVARLLRKYPTFNAFHADGYVNFYEYINVGYAIDAGRGLKVPVIHHADQKSIAEIAEGMRELVVGYLSDELPVEALAGGTFTVTDLSGEGVFAFHPLINKGQSAILGIGGEVFAPGAQEGLFNLILSFDHQLSEGRTAAKFLNDLRQRFECYEASLRTAETRTTGAAEPSCTRCRMTPGELEPLGHYLVQTVRAGGATKLMCTSCLRGY